MKIAVYGLGYVGLTTAACALESGHEVHGVDVSAAKIDVIARGESPIHEPGLSERLATGIRDATLTIDVRTGSELATSDIAMVCVGTPSQSDGSHNMTYILEVTRQIAEWLAKNKPVREQPLVIAYRSTVRPGTMQELVVPVLESQGLTHGVEVELVYHPEFLRESTAIKDYFSPPKIVYGTADGKPCAALDTLYKDIEAPRFVCRYPESEMTKFVDNTFHALKVTFTNEIGRIAYSYGISASKLHEIFIADTKLNISPYYLRPGGAFGGSCLPKDVRALDYLAKQSGVEADVVSSLISSNETHKQFLFDAATEGTPPPASVLLIGLAFKANSDDMRESPLLDLAASLVSEGYALTILEENYNEAALHATNLSHVMTRLPQLDSLVVGNKEELSGRDFDLVIDGRGTFGELDLGTVSRHFDVNQIP